MKKEMTFICLLICWDFFDNHDRIGCFSSKYLVDNSMFTFLFDEDFCYFIFRKKSFIRKLNGTNPARKPSGGKIA